MNRPFPINQFPSLPRYLANDTQIADVPYRLLSADPEIQMASADSRLHLP